MPIICSRCGRDLDEIWQDNMSNNNEPLCEDCYYEMQISDREFYEMYEDTYNSEDCSM